MTKSFQFPGVETTLLHGGQEPDPTTGSRAVPIYQTTSYVFRDTEHAQNLFALAELGNIYSRIMNPTVDAFEQRIALLEDGVAAVATASGASAITLAILNLANAGDEILADSNLYGGTFNLFNKTLPKYGIDVKFVDGTDPENFRNAITPKTKAIFGETITNPSLNVFDLEKVADIAHESGIPVIIDNTFATPYACKPITWGADIVVHSATKWIGGHGTSIGGVVVDSGKFNWNSDRFPGFTEPDDSYNGIRFGIDIGPPAFAIKLRVQGLRDIGACLSPQNAFNFLQGLETLNLRVERHTENAKSIVQYLENHPQVEWVSHPSTEDHPSHALAQKYLNGHYGAIVVFGIKGGRDAGRKVIDNVNLWSHVANVGDAKSLIIHPASTTHQQLNADELKSSGVTEELIRLSVGLESVEDTINDLDQAIAIATDTEPTIRVSSDQAISWALGSSFAREDGGIRAKTIAVAGFKEEKAEAVSKLQKAGFHIIPLSNADNQLYGAQTVSSINEVEGPVDVLYIVDPKEVSNEAIEKASIVWANTDEDVSTIKNHTEGQGKIFVEDRCPFKEFDRLRRNH